MSGTLHDAFIDELRDTYDAEKQLLKSLPKVARAANSPKLRAAVEKHIEETRGHVERLTRVFESIDERPRGKHCDGMAGIIEEAKSALEEDADDATMDALLIASAQRAEHYEMAAYGTLVSWAQAMGHSEAARLLQATLDEEKATDETLTSIAESGINQQAARLAHGNGEEDEETESAPAARRGTSTRSTGRASAARSSSGTSRSRSASSRNGARKR